MPTKPHKSNDGKHDTQYFYRLLTASFGKKYQYLLNQKFVEFDHNLLVSHTQIDEINLFKCTSLSFYDSAVNQFDTKFALNLILLVTEKSEIGYLNIVPLT